MPMMQRALELVNQLSVDRIAATLRPMTDRIAEGARAMVRATLQPTTGNMRVCHIVCHIV